MDLRKYGKPPKKIISAEKALGIAKKTKMKKPKKSKKDKPKKPRKGKPKSILSKTLKRATTTEQSIRNDTQQQFLQNLHGRLNNNDGRTNGIWNSYKRNITAQSFGGTPYEMYRLQEESTILRDMLERATNDGRRRPPQVSTTETQTDTQRPRYQPTTPPTTPPPVQPPQRGGGLRPSNLGFGQTQQRSQLTTTNAFTGQGNTVGGGALAEHRNYPIEGYRHPLDRDPDPVPVPDPEEFDFDDYSSVSSQEDDNVMSVTEGLTRRELRQYAKYDRGQYPDEYGGSDDDEEEYKADTDSNDIEFNSLQGDSSNQFNDADEGY
jgi:hypothetical protein